MPFLPPTAVIWPGMDLPARAQPAISGRIRPPAAAAPPGRIEDTALPTQGAASSDRAPRPRIAVPAFQDEKPFPLAFDLFFAPGARCACGATGIRSRETVLPPPQALFRPEPRTCRRHNPPFGERSGLAGGETAALPGAPVDTPGT
jgi:hypothetical protein